MHSAAGGRSNHKTQGDIQRFPEKSNVVLYCNWVTPPSCLSLALKYANLVISFYANQFVSALNVLIKSQICTILGTVDGRTAAPTSL